jgi:hypothetical protein
MYPCKEKYFSFKLSNEIKLGSCVLSSRALINIYVQVTRLNILIQSEYVHCSSLAHVSSCCSVCISILIMYTYILLYISVL